jgi:hypothetical protein
VQVKSAASEEVWQIKLEEAEKVGWSVCRHGKKKGTQ